MSSSVCISVFFRKLSNMFFTVPILNECRMQTTTVCSVVQLGMHRSQFDLALIKAGLIDPNFLPGR